MVGAAMTPGPGITRHRRATTGPTRGFHGEAFFRMSERRPAMTQSTDTTTHRFDPMAIPGLSRRARESVNAAFEAMSDWRSEIADNNEKNIKRVIEKMASAAAELGWPEQIVDATRTQLQSLTEMQLKTMDQMMDAWEEQLKLPDPATPSAALNKIK